MTYQFEASHIFLEDDGYAIIIGFANDKDAPSKFVLLQKPKEFDEQDKQLGMDKIHIQIEDESRAAYGGIKSISKNQDHVLIDLDSDTAAALEVEGTIDMIVDTHHPHAAAIFTALRQMAESEGIHFVQEE